MDALVPQVCRVGVATDGQDVEVMVPNPGDLEMGKMSLESSKTMIWLLKHCAARAVLHLCWAEVRSSATHKATISSRMVNSSLVRSPIWQDLFCPFVRADI